MSNLVMGIATGYKPVDLEPFVKSLRKHYDGVVVLFMYHVDGEMQEFLNKYNVQVFGIASDMKNGVEICNYRHQLYKEFLENNFLDVERILIADSRDCVFQDNPFNHVQTTSLELFYEPALHKNCECNSWWISTIYGQGELGFLSDKYIVCAGTTMGTRQGIIEYSEKVTAEIERMKSISTGVVVDQPIVSYLYHTGVFGKDIKIYQSGQGPIATMQHHKHMLFDREGNFLNDVGSIVAVVHQWDRTGKFKDIFYNNAMGN